MPKESTGTGYQLSFAFARKKEAENFCVMLEEQDLLAKIVHRSTNVVVYIKSKELISDFLSIVGAEKALKKFSSFLDKREEANRNNRTANCFSGNADKTMQASVKQVLYIRLLEENGVLCTLDDTLRYTAKGRVENPTLSMQELSMKLGISKSCLNHRLRKICEIAQESTKEK
jgi:DNA-binding protein WhiA